MGTLVENLSTLEKFLYLALIPGVILAFVTLFIGFNTEKKRLGVLGAILTLVCGLLTGFVVSLAIAAIFIFLMIKKEKEFVYDDDDEELDDFDLNDEDLDDDED